MSTMVTELYQALRSVGASEDAATAAAQAVWQPEQPATKGDVLALKGELKADLEALRADLTKTIYTTTWTAMLAMTAIFSAISAALRLVKP